MPEPLASLRRQGSTGTPAQLERLTCLSGDPVRSEVLGPEPGTPIDLPADLGRSDEELEARLAPDGMLSGPLTPEACAAYLLVRDRERGQEPVASR
jgi:hypothetical protein